MPKKKKPQKKASLQHTLIILLAGFSLICIVSGVFIFKSFTIQSKNTTILTPSPIPITPTLTLAPLPTATPTATPEAQLLRGYCLSAPVLMYHHIQPWAEAQQKGQTALTVDNGQFERHMEYIKAKGYTPITAEQLVTALQNHSTIPTNSIIITLDDGYRDNYTYAYPILQKHGIVATIMLSTGLMEGADYLTWSQVEEMGRSGIIHYTNHTWSHYSVGKGNRDKIKSEIETASQQLEQHLGKKSSIFTYPYGSMSPIATAVLQENGFIGAFSTIPGRYHCDSNIMALRRIRIGNASLSYFGL